MPISLSSPSKMLAILLVTDSLAPDSPMRENEDIDMTPTMDMIVMTNRSSTSVKAEVWLQKTVILSLFQDLPFDEMSDGIRIKNSSYEELIKILLCLYYFVSIEDGGCCSKFRMTNGPYYLFSESIFVIKTTMITSTKKRIPLPTLSRKMAAIPNRKARE